MTREIGSFGNPYPRGKARRQAVLTTAHTLAYRLSGGRIGGTLLGMPMLLITTRGRRTGRLRTAPLLYLPVDGDLVLVASNGGATRSPTWYYNLLDYPEALAQIGAARGRVRARVATPEERAARWPLLLQIYPGYATYQSRTDRTIPLLLLRPIDAELDAAVPQRFRRTLAQADS